jgi:hypothetical protein
MSVRLDCRGGVFAWFLWPLCDTLAHVGGLSLTSPPRGQGCHKARCPVHHNHHPSHQVRTCGGACHFPRAPLPPLRSSPSQWLCSGCVDTSRTPRLMASPTLGSLACADRSVAPSLGRKLRQLDKSSSFARNQRVIRQCVSGSRGNRSPNSQKRRPVHHKTPTAPPSTYLRGVLPPPAKVPCLRSSQRGWLAKEHNRRRVEVAAVTCSPALRPRAPSPACHACRYKDDGRRPRDGRCTDSGHAAAAVPREVSTCALTASLPTRAVAPEGA